MQAIAVRDRDAGLAGLSLTDLPYPQAVENDIIVRVYAAGFTRGELAWAGTWTDRGGRDRTPSVPGGRCARPTRDRPSVAARPALQRPR